MAIPRRQRDRRARAASRCRGFIDTHLHVESSLVTPLEFDRCVLPHGVTTAICDPHEMANVLGVAAFDYFLAARAAPRWICGPALELRSGDASRNLRRPHRCRRPPALPRPRQGRSARRVHELFPGVLAGDPGCLGKLEAFAGRHIDGHAPLLRGRDLNGYLAAGIRTDHETTSAEEALEKIRKGVTVLIREGSVSKDLHALAPLLTVETSPFLALCTDDRNPLDIAEEGHLDFMIRSLIARGCPPLAAYRAASLTAARAFGLADRGMLAPGMRADIVLVDDLESCAVSKVIAGGQPVDEALFATRGNIEAIGLETVKAARVGPEDFQVPGAAGDTSVIGVVPGKIITEHLRLSLPSRGGERGIDLGQDVVKVAVVARHGQNRNIGRGFVKGFGLARGAIATSVGHDSHNICVVGTDDDDMAVAVNRLVELQGGFCVACGGVVRAELALPIAGLMSDRPFEEVGEALLPLREAAAGLGVTLAEPFLQLAFLPLPVIPHLKITDLGLVDVDRFELIRD
jgi:adenine deaminase